ncbi:mannitol-1-phosphate 5-dehydrogenase [Pisciglobus halotolerans]|uniref:Mannitol-1-phosphate 5-dehydrogenase n=1 Tax=Pisciglobus halotolerans TaxID=745365 RepID=A0A1I3AW33_9LACT|nr:mannitol-1-phosphate 5-dehydrogenase [Pisciglobus halotolerans]SFH54305.1 D-mannitol 1-phosphate 5-dehydrogenase [Pisciglobus halotolerans]
MQAIHFGGGNIGRGFIGEVLNQNDFDIAFVDVNVAIIDALNEKKGYTIELAEEGKPEVLVNRVCGINNGEDPEAVVSAFEKVDIVTTAIGPKILPYIAPLIAQGIQKRKAAGIFEPLDIIACENMINGSSFLKEEVQKHLESGDESYLEQYIGFPNAAVDRIVPLQHHNDILRVTVEPYKEWVIDQSQSKNKALRLEGVHYAEDLEPFIERKLFTVNTGHATTAYNGRYAGYQLIDEALRDESVLAEVKEVLSETGALMIEKWKFLPEEHQKYIDKILSRFSNPYISDELTRVGRTPIRKLGYNERFIRPMREAYERDLVVDGLIRTVAKIMAYRDENDEESQELARLLKEKGTKEVICQVTELTDQELIGQIAAAYHHLDSQSYLPQ